MRGKRGFTLIELAVVATIAGVMMIPMVKNAQITLKQQHIDVTKARMSAIREALRKYQTDNGFYPRPAPLYLPSTDPDYGTNTLVGFLSPGGTTPGIFLLSGTGGRGVTVGAVPASTLNLSRESMKDGWGSLILYAVTAPLAPDPSDPVAAKNSYDSNMDPVRGINNAAIPIRDGNNAIITTQAPFVLLSPGADRNGAFLESGNVYNSAGDSGGGGPTVRCLRPGAIPGITPTPRDTQNCRFERGGGGVGDGQISFIYDVANRATLNSANHYDDYVVYLGSGTACSPGQTIANINPDGSYICQSGLVTTDTSNSVNPEDPGNPNANTLDALTCTNVTGQDFSGVRTSGLPRCSAGDVQGGVVIPALDNTGTVATAGQPCGGPNNPQGQLATDPATGGTVMVCDDDADATLTATPDGVPCTGFNLGAMSMSAKGGLYVCAGDGTPPSAMLQTCSKPILTQSYTSPPLAADLDITWTIIGGGGGGGGGGAPGMNAGGAGGNGSNTTISINGVGQPFAGGGRGGFGAPDGGLGKGVDGASGAAINGAKRVLAGEVIVVTVGEGGGGGGGGSNDTVIVPLPALPGAPGTAGGGFGTGGDAGLGGNATPGFPGTHGGLGTYSGPVVPAAPAGSGGVGGINCSGAGCGAGGGGGGAQGGAVLRYTATDCTLL